MTCRAKVAWGAAGGTKLSKVRDVSRRGLFVLTREPPAAGGELDYRLVLPPLAGSGEVRPRVVAKGVARVVWSQAGTGMGLEFLDLTLNDQQLARLAARPTSAHPPPAEKVAPQRKKKRILKKKAGQVPVQTHSAGDRAEAKPDGFTVGIDLGTSNTCASVVMGGKAQVIPTRWGTNTIPSVVSVDKKGRVLIGHDAIKQLVLRPRSTIYGSKRLMGRSYRQDWHKKFQPRFAYALAETPEHTFGAKIGERIVTMEEVANHLLNEVKLVAEQELGTRVDRAVITVPAYFSEVQRDAVRDAATKAGLTAARIVPEPTAAAIAYGYNKQTSATVAVFDLGGGTFDVSILQIDGNDFTALGTDGDNFLGGGDFDDAIAMQLIQDFRAGLEEPFLARPQHAARVKQAAEEAKKTLTTESQAEVHIPRFAEIDGEEVDLTGSITREQMEKLCDRKMFRIMRICKKLLADLKLEASDLDDVLLVGGATRMPMIQRRVEEVFGRKPNRRINPDEAVALGAAILASEADGTDVTLVDILPLSIGICGTGRRFVRMLTRNTAVPCKRAFSIKTHEANQQRVSVPLFQGEEEQVADNEYLGTVVVDNVPPGAAGAVSYEITLSLDEQSILNVYVRNPETRRYVDAYVTRQDATQVLTDLGVPTSARAEADRKAEEEEAGRASIIGKMRGMLGK